MAIDLSANVNSKNFGWKVEFGVLIFDRSRVCVGRIQFLEIQAVEKTVRRRDTIGDAVDRLKFGPGLQQRLDVGRNQANTFPPRISYSSPEPLQSGLFEKGVEAFEQVRRAAGRLAMKRD